MHFHFNTGGAPTRSLGSLGGDRSTPSVFSSRFLVAKGDFDTGHSSSEEPHVLGVVHPANGREEVKQRCLRLHGGNQRTPVALVQLPATRILNVVLWISFVPLTHTSIGKFFLDVFPFGMRRAAAKPRGHTLGCAHGSCCLPSLRPFHGSSRFYREAHAFQIAEPIYR